MIRRVGGWLERDGGAEVRGDRRVGLEYVTGGAGECEPRLVRRIKKFGSRQDQPRPPAPVTGPGAN